MLFLVPTFIQSVYDMIKKTFSSLRDIYEIRVPDYHTLLTWITFSCLHCSLWISFFYAEFNPNTKASFDHSLVAATIAILMNSINKSRSLLWNLNAWDAVWMYSLLIEYFAHLSPYLSRHNLAVSHQQQLLLLLPSLRQADQIIRKFWVNICREGNVTMNKLFVEMLEPVSRWKIKWYHIIGN